jgi:hypothetical protein
MFASFNRLRSVVTERRTVVVIALVSVFLAIPAVASAAKGTTIRADLAGPTGYCWNYDGATAPAVGKVQITTTAAASPGLHPVRVNVKIRPGRLPGGSYQIWLVQLYRDATGQVVGCAASPLGDPLAVATGGGIDFHGSVDRYTGAYELQVYVGPIWGPGYGTAPTIVDVL